MTTPNTLKRDSARDQSGYYCLDSSESSACAPRHSRPHRSRSTGRNRVGYGATIHNPPLSVRWRYPDLVPELLTELVASGRDGEAAAIRRVLGYDDDEAAMRAYVSRLWADDWDSEADSVYDNY